MIQLVLPALKYFITAQQVFTSGLFLVFLIIRSNEYFFRKRRKKHERIAQVRAKKALQTACAV